MNRTFFLGLGMVAAVVAGLLTAWQPLVTLSVTVLAALGYVALYRPEWLLLGATGAVALGQFGRIPPLSGGAPLLTDLFLGSLFLVSLVWIVWKRVSLPMSPALTVWFGFLFVGAASLVVSPYPNSTRELAEAGLYWMRLLMYSSLVWIVPMLYRSDAELERPFRALLGVGWAVVALGILQLLVLPDIGRLGGYGWDPHVGRFVSTFLDPNYLGGYLAMVLALLLARNLERATLWNWIFAALVLVAGVLTYSRSGYLALLAVVVVAGLRYSWKLFLLITVAVVPLALSIPRVRERVAGGFNIDRTAEERILSWERALTVMNRHPVLGVGYNSYEQAQVALGLIPDTSSHAAAGSDSSLLNVGATTGTVGFALFLISGFLVLRDAWRRARGRKGYGRTAAYTLLLLTPAILLNALFVNALFYPFILLPVTVLIGALYVGEPAPAIARGSRTSS